jgi:hypothetical protein
VIISLSEERRVKKDSWHWDEKQKTITKHSKAFLPRKTSFDGEQETIDVILFKTAIILHTWESVHLSSQ